MWWCCYLHTATLLFFLLLRSSSAAPDTAEDTNALCSDWAAAGECDANENPNGMWDNCHASCLAISSEAHDEHESCTMWADSGECVANPDYMWSSCGRSCRRKSARVAREAGARAARSTSMRAELNNFDYGESYGVDGLPFNLEVVLARRADSEETTTTTACTSSSATTCSSTSSTMSNPAIVRLPENYPANLTLAPPLSKGEVEPTLEQLHAQGILTYASYMRRDKKSSGTGVAVKVVNFRRRAFKKMWDDGTGGEGVYNGEISAGFGDRSTLTTYAGHTFNFIDVKTGKLYRRITMQDDVHYIVFEPDEDDHAARASHKYRAVKQEQRFLHQYYDHYGYPWLASYGRPTPVLNMWPADYLGQKHTVKTQHGHWTCDEPHNKSKCYDDTPLKLDLLVASHAGLNGPRVLVIPDLMSEAECDHVLRLGKQQVKESMVGSGTKGFKSSSRTSSTGWLDRTSSPVLNTMQQRFADVLGLDETRLHHRDLAEQLQVVRYEHGQQYNPHHDFGEDSSGNNGQRFLTLLLYVVVPKQGGHTSFPKAFGGRGMRLKPPNRGGAVLFYSMLPDGNGDDLSLHGGEYVEGNEEKWICNLWVWDPDRDS